VLLAWIARFTPAVAVELQSATSASNASVRAPSGLSKDAKARPCPAATDLHQSAVPPPRRHYGIRFPIVSSLDGLDKLTWGQPSTRCKDERRALAAAMFEVCCGPAVLTSSCRQSASIAAKLVSEFDPLR
jgi:hypothetical protein